MSKETVELMVEGGKATAGAALGQSLGPLKINIGEVVQKINTKTSSFKGMKVPVNTETKEVEVTIGTPPSSELIKKELAIEKGSGKPNVEKVGNISIEQVIKIALMKKDSMTVNSLKAAIKNIIGSCGSLGILIEGKFPKDINKEIDEGQYDSLIKTEKTEIDENKKALLKQQLEVVQEKLRIEQEKLKALEEAEKVVVEKPAAVEEKVEEKAGEVKEEEKEGKEPVAKPVAKKEEYKKEKK